MKKLGLLLAALFLVGCGGSSGIENVSGGLDFENTNFLTTTTEVNRRFLFVFNRGESSVAAYLIGGEEDGGHDHVHGRILAQDAHDHGAVGEEEEFTELDGSPYTLGTSTLVDVAVDPEGQFLVVLDQSGTLQSYGIDGVTGLLSMLDQQSTGVANPRLMGSSVRGHEGSNHEATVAVLGDSISIHEVSEDGMFSEGSTRAGTNDWVDVALDGRNGVASTANGVASFQWAPGLDLFPFFELALPGSTRGGVTYSGSGVWVVNTENNSVSQLTQEANSEIALVQTFALPASLTGPRLIAPLFEGEDLGVADDDTFVLLHPEPGTLDAESEVALTRVPNRIFQIPETARILLGHDIGEGTTTVEIGEDEMLEMHDEVGPGHLGPFGFGYAERMGTVTATGSF